jgi:BirA family biotin operon repressor/biotin-[acetyl-CoA-carboxylase] ligase
LWFDRLDSTNDECTRRARAGVGEGLVVAAGEQTAGHGRFDRVWESPPGGNIYLSILVRPEKALLTAGPLGLAASLAVADSAARFVPSGVELKWPNDLTHRGRKVCGILTVAGEDDAGSAFAVVGIGVNVNTVPQGLEGRAAALAQIAGRGIDAAEVMADTVGGFLNRYMRLMIEGFAPQLREWGKRSGWVGRRVSVAAGGREFAGTALGLGTGGTLLVKLADGSIEEIHAADATLKDNC